MESQSHETKANAMGRRSLGPLAVATLAVGLTTTIGAWRFVTVREQATVHWASRLAAQAIRADIVTDLEWQKVGLDRLALLWEAADPPQVLWVKNAELYLQHRPGSIAVEWFSATGEKRAAISAHGDVGADILAFGGRPPTLIESAARSNTALFSPPVDVPNGRKQWVIARPVYAMGQFRGTILSFFDLEQSLDHMLGNAGNLGFIPAVSQGNQLLYSQPGSSAEYQDDEAVVDTPLSGVRWRVLASPSPEVVSRITSGLPLFTLALGSAFSLLFALTVHFASRATAVSARMRQVNETLTREIRLRGSTEEELRQAQDDLNLRVQKRTAELAKANTELERAKQYLQDLTGRLFRLQDEERRRLARELHDGTTQNLIALGMNFARLRKSVPFLHVTDAALFDDSVQLIDRSIQELRTLSHLLHPPLIEELGLPATLRTYVDGFANRSGIRITLEIEPTLKRVDCETELGIFRIVQECLANIHRHSQSVTAKIVLFRSVEFLRLEVADEGKGISPDELIKIETGVAGVGIAGMRERVRLLGGQFELHSGIHGTMIRILLPCRSVGNQS